MKLRRRRHAVAVLALASCVSIQSACERGQKAGELSTAIDAARPYAAQFSRFESWANRATSVVDPARRSRALSETLFAPLRNDQGVLAAWVAVSASDEVMSLPPSVDQPDTKAWTRARDLTLGWVRVASFQRCPITTPRGFRQAKDPACVIISRDGDDNSGTPRLTMAFVVGESQSQ